MTKTTCNPEKEWWVRVGCGGVAGEGWVGWGGGVVGWVGVTIILTGIRKNV